MFFNKNTLLYYLLLLVAALLGGACKKPPEKVARELVMPFAGVDSAQVEAVLAGLTMEEKIGQMIVWQPAIKDSLALRLVHETAVSGKVGGLLLRDIGLSEYLYTADSLRRSVKLPLFFATDEKVMLHNQFTGLARFPLPVSMAAIDSSALLRELERHFLKQCKALGINFCMNPTLKTDDPEVEGFDYQSYESDPAAIAERSHWMAQSLRNNRIFAVADGFSDLLFEENDTLRDSLLLPFLHHTRAGLTGLKIADRVFKDDTLRYTRPHFIKSYLRNYLDFNGLMVVELASGEKPDSKLLEGADIFLTRDAGRTFTALLKLVENGSVPKAEIDRRVRQILMAKAWVNSGRLPIEMTIFPVDSAQQRVRLVAVAEKSPPGILHRIKPRSGHFENIADSILCYFDDPGWGHFTSGIFEHSVVLARDENGTLPFQSIYSADFQLFAYSRKSFRLFESLFVKYAGYQAKWNQIPPSGELPPIKAANVSDKTVAVVLLDDADLKPGFHKQFIESVNALTGQVQVVFINFGNPKNLRYLDPSVTSVQVFERNDVTEAYTAQMLFGGVRSAGRLPVQISASLPFGAAVRHPAIRLGFSQPEKAGILKERLVGIHAIAGSAIEKGVFPGCQVVVAKDGQVIFSHAFGTHTYDKRKGQPVQTDDLFDVASLTKVAATTLAVMKMEETQKIDLKNKLGQYLEPTANKPVGNIKIKDLLLHNSGLQAQMPLARYFSSKNVPASGCNDYYCRRQQARFEVAVADGLYLRNDHPDTILARVYRLPVSRQRFLYSDVNYFLLQKMVEHLTGQRLDEYVNETFYRPLGLRYAMFNPLDKFSKSNIVPTENDRYWRKTVVHGHVHDPAAALMGGVGGSAGVFSNAEDLAVVFQMLLDGGAYGGIRFFQPETVHSFTDAKHGNHRGLGFDKPASRRYPTFSKFISPKGYGHTGFTGTCVWVDPEEKLVYVFLSNRVHPNARNGKIFTEAVRSRIHDVVYEALGTFEMRLPELIDVEEEWEER